MKRWLLIFALSFPAMAQCASNSFGGPPFYPCASTSTANPGLISAIMTSTSPSGTVDVENVTTGLCTVTGARNCITWDSGDLFNTGWNVGQGPGSGGNVLVNGNKCEAVSWNSTTNATILCSSQLAPVSAVAYSNYTACKGNCQNYEAYDTTIPGWSAGEGCITRITDPATTLGPGSSTGNFTATGGGSVSQISKDEDFIGVTMLGGLSAVYHIAVSGGCVQVLNSGMQPAVTINGNFSFSHNTDNVYYYVGGGTYGTAINKCTLASDASSTSCSVLADFFSGGGSSSGPPCPGVTPFSIVWGPGNFGTDATDDEFFGSFGTGAQGSAYQSFVYSLSTQGGGSPSCSSVNWATNQVWAFCTASCTPSTTALGSFSNANSCWGAPGTGTNNLHDGVYTLAGYYVLSITGTGSWTGGACNGSAIASQNILWQPGTLNNTWLNNGATIAYGGHGANGVVSMVTPYAGGPNIRSYTSPLSFTTFAPAVVYQDSHEGWSHYCGGTGAVPNDLCPWINGANSVAPGAGSAGTGNCPGGTSAIYCPNYLNNVFFAYFEHASSQAPVLFFHNYACGYTGGSYAQCADAISDPFGPANAIAIVGPKGDIICWGTTMLHALGTDSNGVPVASGFCGYLGAYQTLGVPLGYLQLL